MIATLDNFGTPQLEHSVPLEASRPIYHNFPLVRQMITEAFEKSERVVLLLTSNGSPEVQSTEWQLKRVIN